MWSNSYWASAQLDHYIYPLNLSARFNNDRLSKNTLIEFIFIIEMVKYIDLRIEDTALVWMIQLIGGK